jgi:hypothetical protein
LVLVCVEPIGGGVTRGGPTTSRLDTLGAICPYSLVYLLTGVTFVCKVERYARPRPTRTCSGNDPSGPYTRTRHIRIMYEGLMLGRDRHRPHDLAAISPSPNPQPSRARLSASGPQRRPSWPQTGSVAPCAAPALRLRMPQSKDASATVTRPCYLLQVGSSSWSARG